MSQSFSRKNRTSTREGAARLARVFEAAGCRTQMELAAFLGIRQSSISEAKKRGTIPAEWLVTLLLKNGTNPAWVLGGYGAHCLVPADRVGTSAPLESSSNMLLQLCTTEEIAAEVVRRSIQDVPPPQLPAKRRRASPRPASSPRHSARYRAR